MERRARFLDGVGELEHTGERAGVGEAAVRDRVEVREIEDGADPPQARGDVEDVLGGAELVVFHPGFLLGRERQAALAALVEQLADLRERLEAKGRGIPFGIEIMGRVRELGTAEDVFQVAARLPWVRPVLDFAHLHAVTNGGFTDVGAFAGVLELADSVQEYGSPFHIHFSDIAFANRNETKHLPYGEGTLRAEPLAEALTRFERPATVISESPDEESSQAIRAILGA